MHWACLKMTWLFRACFYDNGHVPYMSKKAKRAKKNTSSLQKKCMTNSTSKIFLFKFTQILFLVFNSRDTHCFVVSAELLLISIVAMLMLLFFFFSFLSSFSFHMVTELELVFYNPLYPKKALKPEISRLITKCVQAEKFKLILNLSPLEFIEALFQVVSEPNLVLL